MKKMLLVLTLAFALQTVFAGAAGAAYFKGWDKTISINTGLNLLPALKTGDATFKLQEAVHNELKNATGLEVDHFYYWVEIDGQKVLAVDPARAMY
ncbi:hypothetical protein [Bacillus sp. FJAT-27445]|uniref:hypothetical protein n=1 Tax=Bacillus sp. FJAT-27445 TaxID=1679166 RepID=UPI00074454D8|nr:hypothetical protein [Bacillus sp. FJAT-27445]